MRQLKLYQQEGFADEKVFHGFFTRKGGVSEGVYQGLNVGFGSDDDKETVARNRALIAQELGVDSDNLLTVYQEHGSTCLKITEPHDNLNAPKADAMVTDRPGLALGVMTADCAPVLFYAPGVIGAAHAGWKGALGGVLDATVQAMEELGAGRGDIQAVIGPCIGKASYEVSVDFVEPFMDEDEENERFFGPGAKEDHPLFDLAGYCAFKLSKAGLRQIYIQDRDTYMLEDEFFSYRRTTHAGERDYGRQLSCIAIRL